MFDADRQKALLRREAVFFIFFPLSAILATTPRGLLSLALASGSVVSALVAWAPNPGHERPRSLSATVRRRCNVGRSSFGLSSQAWLTDRLRIYLGLAVGLVLLMAGILASFRIRRDGQSLFHMVVALVNRRSPPRGR